MDYNSRAGNKSHINLIHDYVTAGPFTPTSFVISNHKSYDTYLSDRRHDLPELCFESEKCIAFTWGRFGSRGTIAVTTGNDYHVKTYSNSSIAKCNQQSRKFC